MLIKLMKYPKQIVSPDAKPRDFCGNISAIIEKGRVKKPKVAEKMKKMTRNEGIQL